MSIHFKFGAIDDNTGLYIPLQLAERKKKYSCPECKGAVKYANGAIRLAYFAHKTLSGCKNYYTEHEGETFAHKEGKRVMKWVLNNRTCIINSLCKSCYENTPSVIPTGGIVQLEHRLNNTSIVDVSYIINDVTYIFEVLHTHETTTRPEPWYEITTSELANVNYNDDIINLRNNRAYECVKCAKSRIDAIEAHNLFIKKKEQEYAEKRRLLQEAENAKQLIKDELAKQRQEYFNNLFMTAQKITKEKFDEQKKEEDAWNARQMYLESLCKCGIQRKNICRCNKPKITTICGNEWCDGCNCWKCRC